ncbi:hypothetical protein C8N24_0328 [Solirubrobacter pauli]|uniref:Uncharacterized protein n=1 Tax=Solirubrobacter pauli TaxID=166793 RepID=A0A660L9E4_9ACTN|nr:hypothetical protein [Solirubrobacter pauli]RKQ90523.1 hypothetical protein C8N24_0328 [Solirubrobacter pauli]
MTGVVAVKSPLLVAVQLDGPRLLSPAGDVLAVLGDDQQWRTRDGAIATELVLALDPAPVRAHVDPDAQKRADAVWILTALQDLRVLCEQQEEFTADDVWAALRMPPRESRMIGALMAAGRRHGLVEATDRHKPSERDVNNRRPVLVWRSLLAGQQRLGA